MHLEIYTSYNEQGEEVFKTAHVVFIFFGVFFSIKFGNERYKFYDKASSFRVERLDKTV